MHLRRASWLAELLDVEESRAYALMREGRVPGVVRIGRQVRIDPEAVEAWIAGGGSALPGGWRQDADEQREL